MKKSAKLKIKVSDNFYISLKLFQKMVNKIGHKDKPVAGYYFCQHEKYFQFRLFGICLKYFFSSTNISILYLWWTIQNAQRTAEGCGKAYFCYCELVHCTSNWAAFWASKHSGIIFMSESKMLCPKRPLNLW